MADSRSLLGARPVASIAACWVSFQLLLVIIWKPVGPCSSRTGSASGLGTPKLASDGPMPRSNTCRGPVPLTISPPIPTSFPVPTNNRVERLIARAPGVNVGVGLAAAVGVGLAVVAGLGVNVGLGVTVAVAVGVGVEVGPGCAQ